MQPADLVALIPCLPPSWASTAAPGAGFAETLYPLFRHPRCLTCHQCNSARSQGLAYSTHRSRYLCDTCHHPQLTGLKGGEWLAPLARLDWTRLAPHGTCELIKRNAGATDGGRRLLEHLLHDGPIHWAQDSGMPPTGPRPTLEGGLVAWQRAVQSWLTGGMRCD